MQHQGGAGVPRTEPVPSRGARGVAPAVIRVLAAVGALTVIFALIAQQGRNVSQGYENQQLRTQIDRLKLENSDLRQQLADARSLTSVERVAREMGMQRGDQARVMVVQIQPKASVPGISEAEKWRIFLSDTLSFLTRSVQQVPFLERIPVSGDAGESL